MTPINPLYVHLSEALGAMANLKATGHERPWLERWERRVSYMMETMGHGYGFDEGTTINYDKSNAQRLVFTTSFHHMREGSYVGWTDHVVTVTPTFGGFDIKVTGRDRNDIKDYIAYSFRRALSTLGVLGEDDGWHGVIS